MRQRGFTLIEILVALVVLAVAMAAVISSMASQAGNAAHLKQKTLALIVAHNRLAEVQLERSWPQIGRSDGSVEMAGHEWKWISFVQETQDEYLRRIDIEVRAPGQEESSSAQISGFLAEQ